jgi:glycosyltransferase involved in cell wall biosynthesis
MRFAIDAHAIGRRLTGNEVYIRNLLANLAALGGASQLLAYVTAGSANGWVPEGVVCRDIASNPWRRLGYDLSRRLRRDRPDLLHVQYTAPLGCPAPVVVSVHDVSFLEHPEYFRPLRRLQLRYTVERTIREAARIITGSEFSRDAIARSYGLDRDGIAVVPNAAAPVFRPVPRETAVEAAASRFGVSGPFILTVGDLQPRKNHAGLIKAFAGLLRECPEVRQDLVIAGKDTWYSPAVRRAAEDSGAGRRIRFLGFVSDEELLALYNACDLFIFPSFYEGFGLPVLEAMACGAPVACSNVSACPEVADAAALLFDPNSPAAMARVMAELVFDEELRARMGRLGRTRAAHFSWRKTAQRTLEIYQEVAGRAPVRRPWVRAASLAS